MTNVRKGVKGFERSRKNKVLNYYMDRHNVTLYAIARAFNLTEQQTIKYINNPFKLRMEDVVKLSALFHVRPFVMFELLYCNHLRIDEGVKKDIEEESLSLSKEIGLI